MRIVSLYRRLSSDEQALAQTDDGELRGALLHDLAVVQERSGDRPAAITTIQRSADAFQQINQTDTQVSVLTTLAGIQARGEDQNAAKQTLDTINRLEKNNNVFPIVGDAGTGFSRSATLTPAFDPLEARPNTEPLVNRPLRPIFSRLGLENRSRLPNLRREEALAPKP